VVPHLAFPAKSLVHRKDTLLAWTYVLAKVVSPLKGLGVLGGSLPRAYALGYAPSLRSGASTR